VVVNKNAERDFWKEQYEDEQTFWNSKGLWYGLGVATVVIIEVIINLAKD
jgi:anti-sigma-K factor RskA